MIPESGKWIDLPTGLDGKTSRVLPSFLVEVSTSCNCVIALPIWVTKINRIEGWVQWKMPKQPFDVERVAPFYAVHSTLEAATSAAARLLQPLSEIPENKLANDCAKGGRKT